MLIYEDGVEVETLSSKLNDNNISLNSFMLNGYFDIDTKSKFVPYFGAGIGLTRINFSEYTLKVEDETIKAKKGSDNEFGYQVKAGISYLASDKIDIFGETIFSGTSGLNISAVDVDPIRAWGGQVGLRYRF